VHPEEAEEESPSPSQETQKMPTVIRPKQPINKIAFFIIFFVLRPILIRH
jgi:hypothetical protein